MRDARTYSEVRAASVAALHEIGIDTDSAVGSAVVYEARQGKKIGNPRALAGVLWQFPDRWWFAARSESGDRVYEIDPKFVIDTLVLEDPTEAGPVVAVDVAVSPLSTVPRQVFLFGFYFSRSGREDAYATAAAITTDAGLMENDAPTDRWREIIEEGDSQLRESM